MLIVFIIVDYVCYIFMSVLGGILVIVGVSIIDIKGIKMFFWILKLDVVIWAIVFFVIFFDNLFNVVVIGFVVFLIFFMNKMSCFLIFL